MSEPQATAVPDAVAPPPRHPRFPQLDGLRAIAALSILVVHAEVTSPGTGSTLGDHVVEHLSIGVTIFFLLSGFLLYRPFIAHRNAGPPAPGVVDYAKRRVLRIYPAYWVVLTVLVIVPGVMGTTSSDWLPQYGLVHTLPLSDGPGCLDAFPPCGLAQTWSLAIEVTFYAALPLYVLLTAWVTRAQPVRPWMWIELGMLGALIAIWVLATYVIPESSVNEWVEGSLIGYLLWFALGMGVAVISVGYPQTSQRPWPIRVAADNATALCLVALAAYLIYSALQDPAAASFATTLGDRLADHVAYGLISLLLLGAAVFGSQPRALATRLLTHPVVAWLGLISYGIFLWHYVFTLELGSAGLGWGFLGVLAGTLALTIPCAAASYYLVERPLLRLKYQRLTRFEGLVSRLATKRN